MSVPFPSPCSGQTRDMVYGICFSGEAERDGYAVLKQAGVPFVLVRLWSSCLLECFASSETADGRVSITDPGSGAGRAIAVEGKLKVKAARRACPMRRKERKV